MKLLFFVCFTATSMTFV